VEPVTQEEVFAVFERSIGVVRELLLRAIETVALPQPGDPV
jgi:hypothetical protein